jgi:hypothetical protein
LRSFVHASCETSGGAMNQVHLQVEAGALTERLLTCA